MLLDPPTSGDPPTGFGVPDYSPTSLLATTTVDVSQAFLKTRDLKRLLNRNLSALARESPEEALQVLIPAVMDIQRSLDDLYGKRMFSGDLDPDGFPSHGSRCPLVDGQYIHVVSAGSSTGGIPRPIAIGHGLGRIPQGAIAIYQEEAIAECLIGGDPMNDPPVPIATTKNVYFRPYGSAGSRSIFALF